LEVVKAGTSNAAKIAMIAMTTSNSTKVKARLWRIDVIANRTDDGKAATIVASIAIAATGIEVEKGAPN
jgi:hypothetical protein